jgi:transposase-like protein
MKNCLRCGTESITVSAVGAALVHFVCDDCRRDTNQWHLGHDVTLQDMEYKMPDARYTDIQGGESRN